METKLDVKTTRIFVGLFLGALGALTAACCAMSAML